MKKQGVRAFARLMSLSSNISSTTRSLWSHMFLLLLLIVVVLKACSQSQLVESLSTVKHLPGFHGPLPFHLETGYIGVGESEDAQLFYYFVKSERNPDKDPQLLWLTGGSGCSAWSGLVLEIGPLHDKAGQYNGSVPTLILNPNSWTKVCSIIFVDSPVGTGFSYSSTSMACQLGDFKHINHLLQFFIKTFISNPVHIGGDSYSGITVPVLFQHIINENEGGIIPSVNLQEYEQLLTRYWANDPDVCEALHVRKGSIRQWQRCHFEKGYQNEVNSSFPYHVNISAKGYRSLIYNGDPDLVMPFLATQAWIRSLNYSIVDDWRQWFVQGQVAGHTRSYSNQMTIATVKLQGGGHTAPQYKPQECFVLFKRWIDYEPL